MSAYLHVLLYELANILTNTWLSILIFPTISSSVNREMSKKCTVASKCCYLTQFYM